MRRILRRRCSSCSTRLTIRCSSSAMARTRSRRYQYWVGLCLSSDLDDDLATALNSLSKYRFVPSVPRRISPMLPSDGQKIVFLSGMVSCVHMPSRSRTLQLITTGADTGGGVFIRTSTVFKRSGSVGYASEAVTHLYMSKLDCNLRLFSHFGAVLPCQGPEGDASLQWPRRPAC